MGKRGPAPKPTNLRLLEGNPGGRPINKHEPKPEAINISPPDWFSPMHTDLWNRIIPMLTRLGIATEADYEALVRYVDTLIDWEKARQFLDKNGSSYPVYDEVETEIEVINEQGKIEKKLVKEKRLKYMGQWPQVAIKRSCAENLLRLEQQFGMTPSSRSSIVVIDFNRGGLVPLQSPKNEAPSDDWAIPNYDNEKNKTEEND